MNRLTSAFTSTAAGALLAFIGFYLTGMLAANIDPAALRLTASSAFGPLMLLAWGLPAAALWSVAGFALRTRPVGWALLGAGAEVCILLALAFMQPTSGSFVVELRAWAETLGWPIVFIAVLSPLGSWAGAWVRRSALASDGHAHAGA